ncbi:MAG: hydrogenase maturation nickel metallochaperone HypA [Proteobacteria bacterium]|nr:hydrogenase maturation nickel metallochaperone HypA [Pseudomonadota bacterium]
MHELSLMADLMRKIETIARDQKARRVTRVTITLGALSHLSAAHFCDHFEHAARGTICQDAALDITVSDDTGDPRAQDIVLDSLEIEPGDGAAGGEPTGRGRSDGPPADPSGARP